MSPKCYICAATKTKDMEGFEMFFLLADTFKDSQRKMWDKNGWLDVLFDVQKKAVKGTDEMRQQLGQVFESRKGYIVLCLAQEKLRA